MLALKLSGIIKYLLKFTMCISWDIKTLLFKKNVIVFIIWWKNTQGYKNARYLIFIANNEIIKV